MRVFPHIRSNTTRRMCPARAARSRPIIKPPAGPLRKLRNVDSPARAVPRASTSNPRLALANPLLARHSPLQKPKNACFYPPEKEKRGTAHERELRALDEAGRSHPDAIRRLLTATRVGLPPRVPPGLVAQPAYEWLLTGE